MTTIGNAAILTVTYNPDINVLLDNIKSYHDQVALIVLIDNSTDEKIQEEVAGLPSIFSNIKVLTNKANLGIALAQNIGFDYLTANTDVRFLIEMDQDSSLPRNYVLNILQTYNTLIQKDRNVACVGPIAINALNQEVYHGHKRDVGVISVSETLSSGLLINLETIKAIGVKDSKLFIDLVDWEWCWRAHYNGYETFIDTYLHISHNLGDRHIKFLNFRIGVPSVFRHYYAFRNSLYLMKKKYVPFKWKIKTIVLLLFKITVYPLILPNGSARLKFMVRGMKDFANSKFGIYKN